VEAVQNWPARIDAVTGEDVQAAAKKWLDRRRAVTGFLLAQENADDNAQAA
jgi:zinc protease